MNQIGSARRVLRSAAMTKAVAIPFTAVVLPLSLHFVTLSDYGVWGTFSAVLGLLALAEGGVGTEVSRRVAQAVASGRDDDARSSVASGTSVNALVAIVVIGPLLIAAVPITRLVLGNSSAVVERPWLLFAGALVLLAVGLVTGPYLAALQGLQMGYATNNATIASLFASALATIAVGSLGAGVWALFAGTAASQITSIWWQSAALLRARPDWRFRVHRLKRGEFGSLTGLSGLLLFSSISNIIDYQTDKILLLRFISASAAGVYQLGSAAALQIRYLALLPLSVLLASFASFQARQDSASERQGVLWSQAFGVAIMGFAVLTTHQAVSLWLGNDSIGFATAGLCLAFIPNVWSAPWYFSNILREGHRRLAVCAALNSLTNLVASYIGVRSFGLAGSLVGSGAGNTAGALLLFILMRKSDRDLAPAGPALLVGASFLLLAGAISLQHLGFFTPAFQAWLAIPWVCICAFLVGPVHTLRPRLALRLLWSLRKSPAAGQPRTSVPA